MILIKKINNNFALAEDSKGEKIIVEGRGVGFQKMPCEITDFSLITRTYYVFNDRYIDLINSVSQEILDVSNLIYELFVSKVHCNINQNLPFVLADHISFAIQRYEKNINVNMSIRYDLMQLYPIEYEVAKYALKLIRNKLSVNLPVTETTGIMLNLINSEADEEKAKEEKAVEKHIEQITNIVESDMNIKIDKESFNYSRFQTHLEYLFKRIENKNLIMTENEVLFSDLVEKFPITYQCVENISKYLKDEINVELSKEEKMYVILHVNRLCERVLGL